jgi:hypothetical protein
MYRGTTPEIELVFDFDISGVNELFVTFAQNEQELFTINKDSITISENIAKFRLTQEQTLMLDDNILVGVQARGKQGEIAWASDIVSKPVNAILKDGEI